MTVLNFAKALRLGGQLVAAVHLDRHRVYPLPPAYLEPSVGTVSTPDAPDLTIVGDVRFSAKVRNDNVANEAATRIVADQAAGSAGTLAWRFSTYGATVYLPLGWPTGTTPPQYGAGVTRTALGMNPGVDVLYRATITNVLGSGNLSVQPMRSLDGGATWTPVGTAQVFPSDMVSADVTTALKVGPGWQGRIYWAQLEAINRAQLVLPGLPGNLLTVPDSAALSVTGDFEIVARVSRPDWAATYANIAGKDGSPRGWLLRVAFNALNFVVPTVDGSAQTTVNSTNLGGVNGQPLWVRATRVAATGAVAFYSAPDQPTEPTTWTARGTGTTPAGPMPVSAWPVQIGARGAGGIEPWQGRVARVIVRDAIGPTARLIFPGVLGNYLSVPDAPNLATPGDLEIVARVAPTTWRPATNTELVARYTTSTGQRQFRVGLNTAGALLCYVSIDGTNAPSAASTPIPDDGAPRWVKLTRVAATGSIAFFMAPDSPTEPTVWTAIGTGFPGGTAGVLFPAAAPIWIGQLNSSGTASAWAGAIRRVLIRNGIAGPVVLDVDEIAAKGYESTFRATVGGTVTETGNVIKGRVLDVMENNAATATAAGPAYLSPTVGTITTVDAPDLVITGDIRISAYLRDDSVESTGSRYWAIKFAGVDYEYSMLATYTSNQYATQGWPTGAVTPSFSQIVGSRTQFGTTPPGSDRYLRAVVTGINPNSQALTLNAQGYTSIDGIGWLPAGTTPPAVRADAMSRDGANPLRLGYTAQGRLYWMQVESINRARLIFPGVVGNYLSTPNTAAMQIAGNIEVVVRARLNWQSATELNAFGGRFATTGTGGRSWYLYMDPAFPGRPRLTLSTDGSATGTATSTTAVPFADGATGWLKATYDVAAGTVMYYTAPDQEVEPTTWIKLGGDRTGMGTTLNAATARLTIGRQDVSDNGPLLGMVRRFILRNGIAGPTVFDVRGDDAGAMGAGSTFAATSGHVMTVSQTAGNTVVQPQPDALVWRFDASEAPSGALTYTDPRGRVWTLSAAGAIIASSTFVASSGQVVTTAVTPGAAPPIQYQPDATIWRFDANEWPGGASSIVGADGRTWMATDPNAIAHPASAPDSEVPA